MANSTQEARARRTAARDRRRGRTTEPVEEMEKTAQDTVEQARSPANGQVAGTAAKVVGTAAAAALLGALGGATRALLERRANDTPTEAELDEEAAAEATETGEPQPSADERDRDEGDEEPQAVAEPEPVGANEEDAPTSVEEGIPGDVAAEIAAQARRQLETLLSTQVERVSGLERANGGWSVTLEVVELARIPESTDVLATYELVLDDDRKLVSVNRGRRYRRSQVDEAA